VQNAPDHPAINPWSTGLHTPVQAVFAYADLIHFKVAGLPPLTRVEFEARKTAALAARAEKEERDAQTKLDHIKDDKKTKAAERNALRKQEGLPVPPRRAAADDAASLGSGPEEDDDEVEEEVNVCKSLFDATVLPDVQSAVAHDAQTYGFFLPDLEFVSDVEGLLEYLHEKVM
jgi:pre-60S factor REI1